MSKRRAFEPLGAVPGLKLKEMLFIFLKNNFFLYILMDFQATLQTMKSFPQRNFVKKKTLIM